MKTSAVIVTVSAIASVTLLAALGVISGDQVLDVLKVLGLGAVSGGAGGATAAAIVKRQP